MRAACSTVTSRAMTRRIARLRSLAKCAAVTHEHLHQRLVAREHVAHAIRRAARAAPPRSRSCGSHGRAPAATRPSWPRKTSTPPRKRTAPQRVTCARARADAGGEHATPSAMSAELHVRQTRDEKSLRDRRHGSLPHPPAKCAPSRRAAARSCRRSRSRRARCRRAVPRRHTPWPAAGAPHRRRAPAARAAPPRRGRRAPCRRSACPRRSCVARARGRTRTPARESSPRPEQQQRAGPCQPPAAARASPAARTDDAGRSSASARRVHGCRPRARAGTSAAADATRRRS